MYTLRNRVVPSAKTSNLWFTSTIGTILLCFLGSQALGEAFPLRCITNKDATCSYAGADNAFGVTLRGQCTWYCYGRAVELARSRHLDPSAETIMYDAFWGESLRDAHAWLLHIPPKSC